MRAAGYHARMTPDDAGNAVLEAFRRTFAAQKHLADAAIRQLTEDQLRAPLDENTNSVCVIMKHVAGNLRSRFTDFLTSDGEKAWRDRDDEFIDTFGSRDHMLDEWEQGWTVLNDALAGLLPADLTAIVTIRGEPHTVALALARALAHASYHVGQIVQTARVRCGESWSTITVPRGGSRAHNLKLGYDPRRSG